MALIAADSGGGDFELTPAGNHIGRCYAVVDLGMQTSIFNGEESTKRKVRISWELPLELMTDGRPFSISATYTISLSEKANLRRDLQSWRGRAFTEQELQGFDLFTVLGVPAMLNVIHTTKGDRKYANVAGITPLPKGFECPPAVNTVLKFSLDEFDHAVFDGLPDWLKSKINIKGVQSPQAAYEQCDDRNPPPADFDDDIPF